VSEWRNQEPQQMRTCERRVRLSILLAQWVPSDPPGAFKIRNVGSHFYKGLIRLKLTSLEEAFFF
jgi:hypothetical protein